MYLTITVQVRKERWSGPYGNAELVLQVREDDAPDLEFGTTFQALTRSALDALYEAEGEKDDEEEEDE